jgi:hypothetical protein
MKKTFVSFEEYKNIEKNSLTAVERELSEAAEFVGRVCGDANMQLYCINEDVATYVNTDGNLVQANYTVEGDKILLENIKELVVEQENLNASRKAIVAAMVDNILEDNLEIANNDFSGYFETPVVKSQLREGVILEAEEKKDKKKKKKKGLPEGLRKYLEKHGSPLGKKHKMGKHDKRKMKKDSLDHKRLKKVAEKAGDHKLKEWGFIARNILEFVDFRQDGDFYQNVRTQRDSKGNLTGVAIPRSNVRNEGKILMLQYKDMANIIDGRYKVLSESFGQQANWLKAVNDMRRFNAMSSGSDLQNCFENVIGAWPNLLYMSRGELANKINEALEMSGARNYDDDTCAFLADGVIRTAHKTYTDKVGKIFNAAGRQTDLDDFEAFAAISEAVFRKADETIRAERQVFKDLYRSLSEVYRIARTMGDEATGFEVSSLIHECESVLKNENAPSLGVAEDLALYLESATQALDFDGASWTVMSPVISINGDNPFIHKYGAMNGSPGDHKGPYDLSPTSDGHTVKTDVTGMEYYTNMHGKDLNPNLHNPYAPEAGNFEIKGATPMVSDTFELGTSGGKDTWPALMNPYIPGKEMSLGDSFKLIDPANASNYKKNLDVVPQDDVLEKTARN